MTVVPAKFIRGLLTAFLPAALAAGTVLVQDPPVPDRRPHPLTAHGDTRIDPYYWMRDDRRENPELLAHLRAENLYTEAVMSGAGELRRDLLREILGRIPQEDSSVPVKKGNYWYYTRYERGKEYPIAARRRGGPQGPEEILLDGNQRAEGASYYSLGSWEISSGEDILAFAEDRVGRRQYVVRFKDLDSGRIRDDQISNVEPSLAWANDNKTLFYIEKHPQTLLGYRVRRHALGTDPALDPLVREESDSTFYTNIYKTRSERFVVIQHSSTLSSEVRLLDADHPEGDFQLFFPREPDHEYEVEDQGDRFLVRTNWQAPNFRIVEVGAGRTGEKTQWRDVVAHRDDVFVHSFEAFETFLAVSERSGGLRKIRIRPWEGQERLLSFDEPAYTALPAENPKPSSRKMRYFYSSLTTPLSTYEIDVADGKRSLLKQAEVVGDFDTENYLTEFLSAPARDGASVPISLVYRKGFQKNGSAPLYLYGYGSYGSSSEPYFNPSFLSLLDRGFVVAIAHIRGGQELGRRWYESGKLLRKMNTFTDFIDVTEFLIRSGYAARDNIFAAGASAGGLLIGAVANLRPDLYRGMVARVPFVDVVTTMLDDSIPLTSNEYDEWGDPRMKVYYDYMLSYSPYDQVKKQDYPALLITAGLWDSQVQYWEPVKWAARLREMQTNRSPILLHVNMDAGHGGKSGRFRRHEETALEYAFLLHLLEPGRRGAVGPGPARQ